ncbi:hypothetical protein DL93DRAFT_2231691 [Clavulina sp. PMI_390]|nr:hypothetical protein DL93DRAFT_2231691 [Clavulina sp. PMI_390]
METSQRLVRTYMATGREEEAESLASGIDDSSFTLLNIVQALGEHLTSDENETRTKGVTLLTDVLARCQPSKITAQHSEFLAIPRHLAIHQSLQHREARVLTTFLRGKLEDVDTIQPALRGLAVLTDLDTFAGDAAVQVVESLIASVTMRNFVQNVRFIVYKIVDRLLNKHRAALKVMGPTFVSGYVNLADGEKDPRNLIISFAIVRVLLIEFDVNANLERLFDITFCYFPITFNPPPGNPYGITAEDLKEALRGCLSGHPGLGPLALPSFLEKLSVSTGNAKRDTLITLSVCLPVYGRAATLNHSKKLWDSFKIEIFQPVDPETERLSLRAAQSLLETLYPHPLDESKPLPSDMEDDGPKKLDGLVADVVDECTKILRSPEKSQAQHATKMLGALVGTTALIREYALDKGINHLLGLYKNPDEIAYRAPTLACLVGLLMAVSESTISGVIPADEQPLAKYKDSILGALISGLKLSGMSSHQAAKKAALEGLYYLVRLRNVLDRDELGYVTHNINELIEGEASGSDLDEVRPALLRLLTEITAIEPAPIVDTTLPLLFGLLPGSGPARTDYIGQAKYRHVLASLTTLCVPPALFEVMIVRLFARLDVLCSPNRTANAETLECDAAYVHAVLSALHDVLEKKVDESQKDLPKYIDTLGEPLFWLFLRGSTTPSAPSEALADNSAAVTPGGALVTIHPRVVSISAKIVTLLVRVLSSERQLTLLTSMYDAFANGNASSLLKTRKLLSNSTPFAPLADDAPSSQRALIPLLSAAIIPVRKDVTLPMEDTSRGVSSLVNWSIMGAETDYQALAARHAAAAIINKRVADVTSFLEEDVPVLWETNVLSSDVTIVRRRRALQTYVWITKALLVRNHPDIKRYIDRLFVTFSDSTLGWDVAKALGQLGSGGESVLIKANNAVVGMLNIQKFFTATIPRIMTGCQTSANSDEQTTYLVALTSLIRAVPKAMYAPELPKMMPFVLRGIDLPDEDLRTNVINTLISVAEEESAGEADILADHATSIITSLLKNADTLQISSPKLRETSLRCLGLLPNTIKYSILYPQKGVVLAKLSKSLDDPRRAVRKEAVDARQIWFTMSA